MKVYIFDYNDIFEMIPSPKGGWIIRKRGLFMLIDKSFTPIEEVNFYEGKVVKKITDKRGQEVPIIKAWPHNCNIKCGERCSICGSKIEHEFELKNEFSTENECEVKVYVCKRCNEKRYIRTSHSFCMKEWGLLICENCGFVKSVNVTDDIIKDYAVPPFPVEEALRPWGLSLEDVRVLHEKCRILWSLRPGTASTAKRDPKLERSFRFWLDPDSCFSVSYEEFLKFIPKENIGIQKDHYVRFKYKDSYYQIFRDKDNVLYFDLEYLRFYRVKEGDSYASCLAKPIIASVLDKNLSPQKKDELQRKAKTCRDSLFDKFHPRAEYVWELESLEELLQVLDIYDVETTLKLEEEYQKLVKELKEKRKQYEEESKTWEEWIEKELKTDPVYKKLFWFLSDSAYGMEIRYAVDPYDGFFGGLGIRPWEITEILYEGLKKLGLLKS